MASSVVEFHLDPNFSLNVSHSSDMHGRDNFLTILCNDGFTDLSGKESDGVMWNPKGVGNAMLAVPAGQVPES